MCAAFTDPDGQVFDAGQRVQISACHGDKPVFDTNGCG
jgi:hypothetical protein